MSTVGVAEEQMRADSKPQEQLDAQGSDEPGAFSLRHNGPWQPLGLLTTVKPPALRGRYDYDQAGRLRWSCRALPDSIFGPCTC